MQKLITYALKFKITGISIHSKRKSSMLFFIVFFLHLFLCVNYQEKRLVGFHYKRQPNTVNLLIK